MQPATRTFAVILFLWAVAIPLPASADRVVPRGTVTTGVIARENPRPGATPVGALRPGESAALLESVPRYYKVKLESGQIGFVSKAWTSVVPETAAPAHGMSPSGTSTGEAITGPTPLLAQGQPVDWWFVFKFNTASFPACDDTGHRTCRFDNNRKPMNYSGGFSEQFVYASSKNASLRKGNGCVGETPTDPVGATFEEAYDGDFYYVVWNDQFYDDPPIAGCTKSCSSPWGHSKGMIIWNDAGDGLLMQVSTPSWPASGSKKHPRVSDGNTLGCVQDDDVKVSQHFFALKLTTNDLKATLRALKNASVVTDPSDPQIVRNGGPADVQKLVNELGQKSDSTTYLETTLSTGVILISKPSGLHVPPWQFVSAVLGGIPLRTATWWASPKIPSTSASTPIDCWSSALGKPGPVEIATSGHWDATAFGLTGGPGKNDNHAKIGVSTGGDHHYAIFGDLNQQGALSGTCSRSQNGRGGTFLVIDSSTLNASLSHLIAGATAPTEP